MKVLFVMDRRVNAGSVRAVAGYVAAGEKQALTLAIAFALFGGECWTGRLAPLQHGVLLLFD